MGINPVIFMKNTHRTSIQEQCGTFSDARYRELLELIRDLIFTLSPEGLIIELNKVFETFTGWETAEWTDKPFINLIHSDDADLVLHRFSNLKNGIVTGSIEVRLLKKSGDYIYCDILASPKIENGKIIKIVGIARDISGRKLAEKAHYEVMLRDISERKRSEQELLQAKENAEKNQALLISLNQHLREVREDERAVISRDIHDQLGQSLTALKIDIDWLYNKTPAGSEQKAKLKRMIELVTTTIEDVQRISSELRPSILDDIGLSAAMEWYCEDFSNRTGLPVKMEFENILFENRNTSLAFYRILQESLTNIIRHACAKNAEVNFFKTKTRITLMVQDDGIGISPDKIKSSKSLGLLGMFERIKYAGGNMKISQSVAGGTKITVNISLMNEKT